MYIHAKKLNIVIFLDFKIQIIVYISSGTLFCRWVGESIAFSSCLIQLMNYFDSLGEMENKVVIQGVFSAPW